MSIVLNGGGNDAASCGLNRPENERRRKKIVVFLLANRRRIADSGVWACLIPFTGVLV